MLTQIVYCTRVPAGVRAVTLGLPTAYAAEAATLGEALARLTRTLERSAEA